MLISPKPRDVSLREVTCLYLISQKTSRGDYPRFEKRRDHTSRGLYLARMIKVCMDASGDQSDEQQSREKSIAIEEQKQ